MTDPRQPNHERILELLADRAVFGLSVEEQAELDQYYQTIPLAEREEFDRLAADLLRSGLPDELEPIPEQLTAKILASSPLSQPVTTPRTQAKPYLNLRSIMGSLAIAASVMFAVGIWWFNRPAVIPTVAERRNELLAKLGQADSSIVRLEWTATADPAAKGATGDVVWNYDTHEGYMLFRGLAVNNPKQEQYQLWVFDKERDERYPVDGGVFDIPAAGQEVVVPIKLKLGVSQVTLFAVTVERPGGVVVSTRERLPLLAKVPVKGG